MKWMKTRNLGAVALCAALSAGTAMCQVSRNSEPSELAPKRIVGLQYPRLANLAAVQGRVELEAVVSAEGTVSEARFVSGPGLLVDAAKASLRQWLFAGCRRSNEACIARVSFVFVLEKELCDIDRCPNDFQVDLPGTVTVKSKQARAIVN